MIKSWKHLHLNRPHDLKIIHLKRKNDEQRIPSSFSGFKSLITNMSQALRHCVCSHFKTPLAMTELFNSSLFQVLCHQLVLLGGRETSSSAGAKAQKLQEWTQLGLLRFGWWKDDSKTVRPGRCQEFQDEYPSNLKWLDYAESCFQDLRCVTVTTAIPGF